MKGNNFLSWKCLAVGGVACLLTAVVLAAVEPRKYYGNIARGLAVRLPLQHVLQHKLDDEISRRAWTNLVTAYDVDHSVFLQSDLDRLSRHFETIDDGLACGDVGFGFEVRRLYLQRLNERIDYATNLVKQTTWDFSTNETYRIRRKDAPWPATTEEAEELWRKRLKNEALMAKVNHDLDKATNAVDYVTDVVKRYRQFGMVMAEPDEEAVLQYYLSSVCRAYDPHSDYFSPASKEDFDMEMNLTLCGIGATLSMDEGALKIVEVMPGSPCDRDGRIKEGDKIVGVMQEGGEMEDVMWQPMRKTIHKIRGKKGTRVTLEVVPRSDPSGMTKKRVELVRDEIKLEDLAATGRVERVEFEGKTRKLGYVFLPGFYGTMDRRPSDPGFRSCAMDIAKILGELNAEGVEGLVLDLRDDGGGSLTEAVRLAALFVYGCAGTMNPDCMTGEFRPGTPVVQIAGQRGRRPGSLIIPPGNPIAFYRPMVVLVSRASASASEIVAGFLQDSGRALVLGDRCTHGKGTVQTVYGLGQEKYGSYKVTTARFYRIDGRSTQMEGVASDVHLPSLIDGLDVGESSLPCALPFSRIQPADYRLSWNMHKYAKELRARSEARTSKDARFQKHLAGVKGMKEFSDRQEVPLEYGARLAQVKADRELNKLDDDENDEGDKKTAEKKRRRKRNEPREDDVVLEESFRVLIDLVDRVGDEEVPEVDF